jgi:hypothetical protein
VDCRGTARLAEGGDEGGDERSADNRRVSLYKAVPTATAGDADDVTDMPSARVAQS